MSSPFTVNSDIDLGARGPATGSRAGADVAIREGEVPRSIEAEQDGVAYQLKCGEFLLNVPDGSRIYVKDGREIVYQRGPETGDHDLSLFILGSAWGALCYQRGLIPIHASANIVGGKLVAFTGHSGAGKSTLATNLAVRGYDFFTDDTLIFDPANSGEGAGCYAGQKQLRLWGDAIKATGAKALRPVRDHAMIDKHIAVPPSQSDLTMANLTRLIEIRMARGDATEPNSFVDYRGAEALKTIRHNLYRPHYAEILMGRKPLFLALKALIENVQISGFVRIKGKQNYEQALDFISDIIDPPSGED